MQTCKLMHCEHRGNCHLEESGATDLCPVLQSIMTEARLKTELAWRDKYPVALSVPLEQFKGTERTVSKGFTMKLALSKLNALELARRDVTLKTAAFHRKHNSIPSEPKKQKGSRQTWGRGPKKIPVHTYPQVKLESYSVYEFKTTPPAVPKTEIVKTRQELFELADRKEHNRVHNIMVGRGLTIERLMNLMEIKEVI